MFVRTPGRSYVRRLVRPVNSFALLMIARHRIIRGLGNLPPATDLAGCLHALCSGRRAINGPGMANANSPNIAERSI